MEEAGLQTVIDPAGNLVGRRGGVGAAVMLGSHTDTVAAGGLYDGIVGVVAALETARLVDDRAVVHPNCWTRLRRDCTILGLARTGVSIQPE